AAALALVAEAAAPDREERLLGDVLGDHAVADHAVGEREGRTAVPVVDRLERARVSSRDELHELLVGQPRDVRGSDHARKPPRGRLPVDSTFSGAGWISGS